MSGAASPEGSDSATDAVSSMVIRYPVFADPVSLTGMRKSGARAASSFDRTPPLLSVHRSAPIVRLSVLASVCVSTSRAFPSRQGPAGVGSTRVAQKRWLGPPRLWAAGRPQRATEVRAPRPPRMARSGDAPARPVVTGRMRTGAASGRRGGTAASAESCHLSCHGDRRGLRKPSRRRGRWWPRLVRAGRCGRGPASPTG